MSSQTRVDPRALMVAAVSGAGLSLFLAAAFVAGGAAGDSAHAAQRMRLNQANEQALAGIVADIAVQQETAPKSAPAPSTPINFSFLRPAVLDRSAPMEAHPSRPMRDVDCLTAAVYYESRGEPEAGQAAVAQVVLNRVRHPGFPKSVCGVVYQGAASGACQFSFACDGSMDRDREQGAWRRAQAVAQRALSGYVMDAVGQATHYHAANLGDVWGDAVIQVAQIGQHIFYSATRRHPVEASASSSAEAVSANPPASAPPPAADSPLQAAPAGPAIVLSIPPPPASTGQGPPAAGAS